jgi:putative membrane protein
VIYGDIDSNGTLSSEELLAVGAFRTIYIGLLLSHIGLSVVVVPLVLLAFYFALNDQIDRHKRIVKFTWPIWFYVSVTGVLVYLMIKPFYT